MSTEPFISHGQNREDVVLWRALHDVVDGRYVEVGANDPVKLSITKAFYDRGWSGLTVEPDPAFAARNREQRPRDTCVEAAVTARGESVTLHLIPDTGLSTLQDDVSRHHADDGYAAQDVTVRGVRLDDLVREHGYDQGPVHFLVVDVEGAEAEVLSTVDLTTWRPWVLVVEATEPLSTRSTHEQWEPALLAADYRFCLFDGVSRFYVAAERADELGASLSYPACALDDFRDANNEVGLALTDHVDRLTRHVRAQETHIEGLRGVGAAEVLRWRRAALVSWANSASVSISATSSAELGSLRAVIDDLQRDHDAVRATVSWRVTRPLRAVRRLGRGAQ